MCPMQSRISGVRINYLPMFLAEDPDDKTHEIRVDDLLKPNEPLVIPLELNGVMSYLLSRNPNASEYEYESITHIDMTS